MLRSLVKTGAACALTWTGSDKLVSGLVGSRHLPLIVDYHQVVERFSDPGDCFIPAMRITRRMFERQLDWIGRRFRFVSLDELGARLEEGRPFDKPVAAITFDDGYRDGYHHAFPVLKWKGIPATFFVVTDLIGTSQAPTNARLYLQLVRASSAWRSFSDELSRVLRSLGIRLPGSDRMSQVVRDPLTAMYTLHGNVPQADLHRIIVAIEAETGMQDGAREELLPFSWNMLAEMHRAGMTIGSHTKTHAVLTNEPLRKMHEEVLGSRQTLEKKLGITVEHFAYTDGRFNAAAVAAVAVSGYRFAYTSCLHRDLEYPLLTIPRTVLWEKSCLNMLGCFSSAVMSCHVHRVFDLVAPCALDHGGPRPARAEPGRAGVSHGADAIRG